MTTAQKYERLDRQYSDFKVVRLGLERKMKNILAEFIAHWRTGGDLADGRYL